LVGVVVQFHGHTGELIVQTLCKITEILNCEYDCTVLFMIKVQSIRTGGQ